MIINNNIEILHGDCLELMEDIKPKSIRLIATDLPYGITQNSWDFIIPINKMWDSFDRVLMDNGVIALTASQPFSSMLVMSNLKMFKHEWIWIKNKGSNFANTVREPFKEHEHVLIFSKGKWVYNKQMQERTGGGLNRVKYDFNTVTKSENYKEFERASESKNKILRVPSSHQKFNTDVGLHPTQKPVKLMEYIIKTYSNEGDIILDCCAGSFTTAIATINTNRKGIFIEKEEKYFNIGKERIFKHLND